ncbi:MAG: hypothetical protein IH630_01720 [Thermoplasmata archaeon]|nr:hypothetical protein [Thermoplasmata archaeon]MCJ7562010.1 SemiSWEET family transporter [Thermoplasmata archaeon]
MEAWTVLGILAGAMTSSGYVPQIVKGWHSRKMDDVSFLMPAILGMGMFLWLLYGIHMQDFAIIVANITGCALTAIIIAMKLHFDARSRSVS